MSLADKPNPQFNIVDSTLYTTILDSSMVRCKSEFHLVGGCSLGRKRRWTKKGMKKTGQGASAHQWKYEKWFHNNTEGCNLFQQRACQQHVCKACREGPYLCRLQALYQSWSPGNTPCVIAMIQLLWTNYSQYRSGCTHWFLWNSTTTHFKQSLLRYFKY